MVSAMSLFFDLLVWKFRHNLFVTALLGLAWILMKRATKPAQEGSATQKDRDYRPRT